MKYDDKTVNMIIDLWNEGYSAGEISHKLKVTRNMVMGKISRLRASGMSLRTAPKKLQRAKKVEVKTKNGWVKKKETKKKPAAVGLQPIEQFVFDYGPIETNIDIMQLTPRSCRYIIDNDRRRGALYCGEPKHYRSYCEAHAKLCYISAKPKDATEWLDK